MGPLLEIWVDGEAVITLLSKCLRVTASIVYFSVSCKTSADGSFPFEVCEGISVELMHIHGPVGGFVCVEMVRLMEVVY